MKPIRLEFQAFGPYEGREVVDFDALRKNGLFLICGKTGIGKTMILDAMTFALYGKSSGKGRDDFASLRCEHVEDAPSETEFTFENEGKVYQFRRTYRKMRKNFKEEYFLGCQREDGVFDPLFENPRAKDLNQKAEEIVGLSYDQFRQVMILPQGQFERLLTSGSGEKEEILSDIFNVYKWKEIAEIYREEAEERYQTCKNKRMEWETLLAATGCENMEELQETIQRLTKGMEDLSGQEEEFKKREQTLKAQRDMYQRFQDLHQKEQDYQRHILQETRIQEQRERMRIARKAESLREFLDESERTARDYHNNVEKLRNVEEEYGLKKSLYEKEEKNWKMLLEKESEMENLQKEQVTLEQKREGYEKLEERLRAWNLAKKEEEIRKNALKEARKKKESLDAEIARWNEIREQKEQEKKHLWDQYLTGIPGILAKGLKEGDTCPVCGSVHHPKKAEITEKHVSTEEVDEKEKELQKVIKQIKVNMEQRARVEKEVEKAQNEFTLKHNETMEKKGEWEESQNNKEEGIDSLQELEKAIREILENVAEFKRAKEQGENRLHQAKSEWDLKEGEKKNQSLVVETVQKQEEEANRRFQEEMKQSIFQEKEEVKKALLSSEEQSQLQNEINRYEALKQEKEKEWEKAKKALKEEEEPEEEELRKKEQEWNQEWEAYIAKKANQEKEIQNLSTQYQKLSQMSEGLQEQLEEAEEDQRFAKNMCGQTGIGLQRYVLGIMFNSVIAAANQMLKMVHDGRYLLYRTEDKVMGNKRGLDLFVRDQRYNEGRSVQTLSGGEKFLVSLALSIGMSTIAQRSGIKIDALFIDEGFGSLDENSIEDAMNVLQSMKDANGVVGIISHVSILRDRIPTKLLVEKTAQGSRILYSIG